MNELVIHEPVEVLCGAKAFHCVCWLPPHEDETPHACDPITCGGEWRGEADSDSFEVVRLPVVGGAL